MTAVAADTAPPPRARQGLARWIRRHPQLALGGLLILAMVAMALAAPLLAGDPIGFKPSNRLKPPSAQFWFGTDNLGRDVYNRTVFGARVSLLVGLSVALLSVAIGLTLGLIAGYFRRADAIVMRFMDGFMSIPAILLAIALVAVTRANVGTVIAAITLPEIPRVVRLMRSLVLTIRTQPYVAAAIASGARPAKILWRHILPNTLAPLTVQATYVAGSAVLIEAALSFLGAGTPPEVPSWGNMISGSKSFFQIAPWTIFFPGACLAITVLGINLLGDGLRDRLDPRLSRRM